MPYRFFSIKRYRSIIALSGLFCFFCTISPVFAQFQETKIKPANGDPNDRFGESVAIDGNTVVVGAFRDDDSGLDAGTAYVYTFQSGSWAQTAKLVPRKGGIGLGLYDRGLFGNAVDIRNNVIAVGAFESRENLAQTGAAYIFTRATGGQWELALRLVDADEGPYDYDSYGSTVATNGTFVFVGALDDDPAGLSNAGAVYVYRNSGTSWTLVQKLTASDAQEGDGFGWYVSVDNNRLLVGARNDDDKAENAGAAYIFEYNGEDWIQKHKIYASDAKANDSFGEVVDIEQNRLIVGARDVDDLGEESGAAYIFEYDGTNWVQVAKLTAFDGVSLDRFGNSVSISGDFAVVSTRIDDDFQGSMYVFQRFSSTWTFIAKVVPPGAESGDLFGQQVAMDGTRIISGAKGDDDEGADAGAAYIYDLVSADRGVLVALYTNTAGSGWTNRTNWLSREPIGSWYGITTNENGRVTAIELNSNNLTGMLPPALGSLPFLEVLQLQDNQLTGSIPEETGDLENLVQLSLAQNHFQNEIPPSLGQLVNLSELNLSDNQLSDTIPAELGNLPNLNIFQVQRNQIDGLPAFGDGAFPSITSFSIHTNRLTFEDLEPNVGIPGIEYSPQATVGELRTEFLQEGDPLILQIQVGGENNAYQWSKDGAPLDSQTSDSIIISSVNTDDAGAYLLTITNSTVPGLTLTSEPITVIVAPTVDFSSSLSGLHVVPPVLSPASGTIDARLSGNQLTVSGIFEGLAYDFGGAYLHAGAFNVNTQPAFELVATVSDGQGGFSNDANIFELTSEQIIGLQKGLFYVSIETAGGTIADPLTPELRGQLYLTPNEAPSAPVITEPVDGLELDLDMPGMLTISWEESTDAQGHPVHYLWGASRVAEFQENPELTDRIERLDATTTFTISHTDLDAFLASKGVPQGATVTLYYLIAATDGDLFSASDMYSLTLTRSTANQAPRVENPVADFTYLLENGPFKISLDDVFLDPDSDPLLFEAFSSDTGVAETELILDSLLVTPVTLGTTTIMLTASDGSDIVARDTFDLTINQAPQVVAPISNQTFTEGDDPFTASLTTAFVDQDDLTYSASSDAPNVADAEIDLDGETLRITPNQPGTATVTVTATDDKEATGEFEIEILVRQANIEPPSSLVENINITFGNPELETSYRLVGLPGDVDLPLGNAVNGTPEEDWIAFRDTGGSGDREQYLQRYDGTASFTFRPGSGFWLLSKSSWQRSSNRSTVTLDSNRQYSIPLHNGWNIISNPFDIDISWQAVRQLNGITQVLHRWNGQFQQSTVFTSARNGEAFYFFNDKNLAELSLPYEPATQTSASANRPHGLRLSVISDGDTLSQLYLGLHEDALDGLDPLDQIAPPGAFQKASLYALRADLPPTDRKRLLAEEYQPAGTHGARFDLALRAPADRALTIAATGMENFPNHYDFVLFDKTLAKRYDIRITGSVSFWPSSLEQELVLLIGDEAYINEAQAGIAPSEMMLLPNYPNPFNEETTIEFTLPEPAPIRLVVYDALGRKIRVLTDGLREAGHHTVVWDGLSDTGTRLGSGLYFYRLFYNEAQRVRRMILRR